MELKARIIAVDRAQAVLLPDEFHFEENEVYIRRDPDSGDVILSRRPASWQSFFDLDTCTEVSADFMTETDRAQWGLNQPPTEQ